MFSNLLRGFLARSNQVAGHAAHLEVGEKLSFLPSPAIKPVTDKGYHVASL